MSADADLIRRSGELKRELLNFAKGRRFRRALQEALRDRFGTAGVGDENQMVNFFDHFLLQRRLPDGRTLVEHFVSAHPELPESERAMLLGWQDVVEGIFAVQRREGEALIVVNLVDELTYRVRSNAGPAALAPMKPGSFLITRLVPVEDEWLLSGSSGLLPASSQRDAVELAAKLALQRPALAFRNPEKLEQAWELQRKERQEFIAFFGSDLVIIPTAELEDRLQAYLHFHVYDVRDEQGRSAAERAEEEYGAVPEIPQWELPADLVEGETVGVIYDEVEGFNLFPELGTVAETFDHPELVRNGRHREAVLEYLESPGISPLPLRRLAERNPEHASQVFRQVLRQRDFVWERDGEALLRRYKASYFEQPPLPGVVPVRDSALREHLAGPRGETTRLKSKGSRRSRRGRHKKSER